MTRQLRMHAADPKTSAVHGRVVWSPLKSIWLGSMMLTALIAGPLTFGWDAAVMSGVLTASTLCFGHSVGLHRLLIHRSFKCPQWLEYCMVYAGVLVGLGGPRRMLYMHDIRDWAQRQPACHPFFIHQSSIVKDGFWNLHCECRLDHPPEFRPEESVSRNRFYRLLDRCWIGAQLPLAAVLYLIGGLPWVVWGTGVRITVSTIGHWLVGYIAHNIGQQDWLVEGASVQGYNVPGLGLLTMGEAWHNNHHAFPDSARLGINPGQTDPGWWLVRAFQSIGLATGVTLPRDLPDRPELRRIHTEEATISPARLSPATATRCFDDQ
ncbi:MAG: hypothetical protein KDA96_06635 [Planctomycetaceae bacterium]|nr:hypothetical protein [Planctomycetaceae bacterium]